MMYVTLEQAKEIIFRTDTHLWNPVYGGNNKNHERRYEEETKVKEHFSNIIDQLNFLQYLYDCVGVLNLEFIKSSYSYSAYIGGPTGFCSPSGKIFYNHNIGKWPSVEEVYNEFNLIADAFPFISLKATIYNQESCYSLYSIPVVHFIVENGIVTITEQSQGLDKYKTVNEKKFEEHISAMINDSSRELGLPHEWYDEAIMSIKLHLQEYTQIFSR